MPYHTIHTFLAGPACRLPRARATIVHAQATTCCRRQGRGRAFEQPRRLSLGRSWSLLVPQLAALLGQVISELRATTWPTDQIFNLLEALRFPSCRRCAARCCIRRRAR
jgi:uncharacterized membrane protein